MSVYLDDGDVILHHGDALERLREMPSESVQCIVTSPPFWGLRDYGEPGQIGLEATPDEWCAKLVGVMREARRVLRSDGVCWIEVGDTYSSSAAGNGGSPEQFLTSGLHGAQNQTTAASLAAGVGARRSTLAPGLKPKDLVGAPWLLAFALRADGWYLRSDTIWARPNPMPESVTDRPTKAHSYVFLLSKSARYFFDADAIRETAEREASGNTQRVLGSDAGAIRNGHRGRSIPWENDGSGRNARSVWSIPTEPTPFAHFATFPQALVERCIKAGTSEHGCCGFCGAPRLVTGWACDKAAHACSVYAGMESVKPCVVLDPFMGSGTTALVARRLGRHAIGVELNLAYLTIAATRLQQLSLLGGHA